MAADRDWGWIAWLILGIGGLILAGGLALGLGSLRHILHGERADGEVIEMRREGNMYAPVVRFRLPSGQMQEVKDLASGAPDFAVGDKVAILYMPQEPRDFRIDTFDRLWFSAILVSLFGGFWLLFAAIAWALWRGVDLFLIGERAFAVIAAVAGVTGVFVLWSAADLYTGGVRADGRVQEIQRTAERASYVPVVRFTTREDREIEFHGHGGSGTSFASGERVTVIYDPTNPIRARIVSFADIWLSPVVPFAVAVVFGGVVFLSRRVRQAKSKRDMAYVGTAASSRTKPCP